MTIAPGILVGGHYRIITPLGSGNFGETFLAEDTHAKNRKCVVKKFNFSSNNPAVFQKAKDLFKREADVLYQLSSLSDHHYVPHFFAFFNEGHEYYLVEEWINGHTLDEELQSKQKLTEDEVVDLLEEVLKALQFIHRQGMIHRDIKPENLMRRNQDGKIVLIDFGAVKEEVAKSKVVNTLNQIPNKATQIFTEGYAPPEQRQGSPEPNSDIYALGITALQLLTGLEPKDLKDQRTGKITWPSGIEVSQEFANILEKMVSEEHWKRPQSAGDVLKNIDEYRQTKIVLFGVPSSGSKPSHIGNQKSISSVWLFASSGFIVALVFSVISFATVKTLFNPVTDPSDTTQETEKTPTITPQETPSSSPKRVDTTQETEKTPTITPQETPSSSPNAADTGESKKVCPPILAPGQKRC
ncbi:MAG: serine/threonine protein kinase [Sphaerospermopsis sp. SIO1G1]|nr:serine/threonine protein kinase [Sphaerospermopsis sp. SIO1G1]